MFSVSPRIVGGHPEGSGMEATLGSTVIVLLLTLMLYTSDLVLPGPVTKWGSENSCTYMNDAEIGHSRETESPNVDGV